jgi:DNA polymerase-1
MNSIHLIDASIYVFRSYFSVATEFRDRDEAPVHAVFGFLNMLMGMLADAQPTHVAICFDESLTTSFRNRLYPAYKANRELPPADLAAQFAYCQALCRALGLCVLVDGEYEADDLVGSALQALRPHGFRGVLVTGDKDFSQLVGEHDEIFDVSRRERTDAAGVKRKYGVRPEQFADYLALTGDSVDNIPGIHGIGPKTAATLIGHFGSLSALLDRVEEVPFLRLRGAAQIAEKLRAGRAEAELFRQLSAIALHAPVPADPASYRIGNADQAALTDLLERLRFGPITRRRCLEWACVART